MARFIVRPDGTVIDTDPTASRANVASRDSLSGKISRFGLAFFLMMCGFLMGMLGSAFLFLIRDCVEATQGIGTIERTDFSGKPLRKRDMPWLSGLVRFEVDGKVIRRRLQSGNSLFEATYEHGQQIPVLYNPSTRRLTIKKPVSVFIFAPLLFLASGLTVYWILRKGFTWSGTAPTPSSSAVLRCWNRHAFTFLTIVGTALGAFYGSAFCASDLGAEDVPEMPKLASPLLLLPHEQQDNGRVPAGSGTFSVV